MATHQKKESNVIEKRRPRARRQDYQKAPAAPQSAKNPPPGFHADFGRKQQTGAAGED
jgi:hypothetical protein